jgi:mannosyltransferase
VSATMEPPAARSASDPAATTHARGRGLRDRAAAVPGWLVVLAGLAVLVGASVLLRTQAITAKFWIDEGLSVGIAHHPFLDIPGVLRQDGSPPLYYLLLHVWMGITGGDGEARTHALSLLFAVLTIPAGWYAGRTLFGTRSGWATAALCATCPFLTYYAQETRMYALVALLGLVGTGAFAAAYGQRDRRFLPVFSVAAALTVYTHNWGLFLLAGMGVAFLVLWRTAPAAERRDLFRDGLLGFGGVALLYLPWVPTLLFQAAHTGAPWSERPDPNDVIASLYPLIGGVETALLVAFAGIGGLLAFRVRDVLRPQARAALAIAVTAVAAVVLAWLASQASPAWASRYFAVFVGPLMLLTGAGIVRFGKLGLVALAVILFLWFDPREGQIRGKSDAYRVARTLDEEGLLVRGDLIVAIHPEQGPLMRYYLGPGYRWADALGFVPDNRVFDWRDALDRFKAAKPRRTFNSLAATVKPGQHLILLQPIIRSARWGAPWMVRKRAPQWERVASRDPRFARVGAVPQFKGRGLPRGVRAVVYLRR